MHQQVRCLIRSTRTASARATLDEESLVEILTLLSGTQLRSAGRVHADGGGEFVFSVDHRPGDDSADNDARDILRDYGAEVYRSNAASSIIARVRFSGRSRSRGEEGRARDRGLRRGR